MTETPPAVTREKSDAKFVPLVRVVISLAAIGGAAAHLAWPELPVDVILIGLLLVAIIPWLGYVLESLELPGGTKMKFREMERRLKATEEGAIAARAEANGANQKAEFALGATERPAVASEDGRLAVARQQDAEADLSTLINEYNEVRRTQESGPARTTAMTRIVGKMAAASKEMRDFDITSRLKSEDGGQRLAAYARLFARPEATQLAALVDAVTNCEPTAFGQYWGIQAIMTVVGVAPPRDQSAVVPQLRAFLGRLREDTDRHYELTKIFVGLGG